MVGDSAGIRISGMSPPSRRHIHIGPELGHIRLGIGQGEVRGIGDALANLGVDALQFRLVGEPLLQQARLDLLDQVVLSRIFWTSSLERYLAGSDMEWPR